MPENVNAGAGGYPIYSLERVRVLGHDPAKTPSCAPSVAETGDRTVLGCQCFRQCRFDRLPYGTFKGIEPQRVGYFYRTIEGREKTDQIACHQFVMTLQAAEDEAKAAELRGDRHETVRIIAHQGETFKRVRTKVHPLAKDGAPRWEPVLEEVLIKPMVEAAQDVYEEYRKDVADQYAGNITVPLAVPDAEAATRPPGRPMAQPVGKRA
mgnify:CR=1 FL=1